MCRSSLTSDSSTDPRGRSQKPSHQELAAKKSNQPEVSIRFRTGNSAYHNVISQCQSRPKRESQYTFLLKNNHVTALPVTGTALGTRDNYTHDIEKRKIGGLDAQI